MLSANYYKGVYYIDIFYNLNYHNLDWIYFSVKYKMLIFVLL